MQFSGRLKRVNTETEISVLSLILWSQVPLRNPSENFRSDISHPNLVQKSDNENSDHFVSDNWAISEVQKIKLRRKNFV